MGKKIAPIFVLIALIALPLCVVNFEFVEAQFLRSVYINPDGSVTGTSNIQRDGNVYTLTGNISGGIQVQKSYIVIDGAGYTIEGKGEGIGIDLSSNMTQGSSIQINNVTVKNLRIVNCFGIGNENTDNNTFVGNYIANCDTGFWITGSSNNTLIHNTVKDCVTGISINYGSGGNVIVENNIMSSFSVWLSPDPTVDRNYWGDYVTRFPDAKEIDNSGIWDTPYSHGDKVIDNHPLIEPVPVIPEFPSWIILPLFIIATLLLMLVYLKRYRH
jgi:parallel beta-helix repeat protein